jgi:hypothetical protein
MSHEVKQLGEDHEVWLKCFVATLSGGTTALGAENSSDRNTSHRCAPPSPMRRLQKNARDDLK